MRSFIKTFAILTALLAAASSWALDLERKVDFSIPAQGLDAALVAFSKQAQLQVVTSGQDVKTLKSSGVTGTFSISDALEKLLEASGLRYRPVGDSAVSIGRFERVSARVLGLTEMRAAADARNAPDPDEERDDQKGIAEILVKGSRTLNTDIRRTEDDPQPYVVLGREDIERSMSSNLEDFLRTRLPMNTAQNTNAQTLGVIFGNQSQIDLRGLGTNQTLILMDGRRLPSVSRSGQLLSQADLNGIPLAAIERVEILASTASGIYGGGATGGVINIITRKDYSSINVELTYGNTFDIDTDTRRVDASAGFNLAGGRTHVLIAGTRAEAGPLLVRERNFVARARALQLANNPAAFYGVATPPQGDLTNIRSADGSNLVLDTGGALNSPFTHVPAGYAGTDAGAALVANAGRYALGLPNDTMGGNRSLVRDPTIQSMVLNLRQEFTSRVQGFLDLSRFENKTQDVFGSLPFTTTLPGTAANNPFTAAINVSFPAIAALSLPNSNRTETLRAAGGLIVNLPRGWTASADYTWGRSRWEYFFASPIVGDPDGSGPRQSVTTGLSTGALNVMRDLNAYPLDFSAYLLPSPNRIGGPHDTTTRDATLRFSGPLLRLPGGPLTMSGFAQRVEEKLHSAFTDILNGATAVSSTLYVPERSQDVNAYYAELRAPLVSAANAKPAVRALDLQVSARRDDYRIRITDPMQATLPARDSPKPDFIYSTKDISATTYTLGLRYTPVEDVVLRASFGTGFLPPPIHQLLPFSQTLTLAMVDPKRERVSTNVTIPLILNTGNPALIPEESESRSVGLILTPRRLPGLRVSLDYTRTEKTDEIVEFGLQQTLDLENLLPGRVTRAPLTPADQALGYTGGVITVIDATPLNAAAMRLEAYDLQADYRWTTPRAGTFDFRAIVTRQAALERQTVATFPFIDFVGFNNSPLEWRGNAGVSWALGQWTFGWDMQYMDSYFAYAATANASARASAVLNQGSDSIASQTYHDIFGRYRFDADTRAWGGVLSNAEIALGIQNVLDRSPPILATTATTGGYSTYGDPRLRRFTLTLRKSFGR